jgi:S-(hydroxymethyl)glutathione dehydrogenase/alcohol dehydrogenase
VRVLASGICHSDLFVIDNPSDRLPMVLGHEAAGIIDMVGPGVDRQLGEHVTIGCHTPCRQCADCGRGHTAICASGWGPVRTPFIWRGEPVHSMSSCSSFAQQIVVEEQQAYNSEGIPDAEAALIGCAVSTGIGASRNLGKVQPGDVVVVIGIGGVGVNAIQGARLAEAGTIVAVDLDARKLAAAGAFGAGETVQVGRGDDAADIARKISAVVPRVDVVIECSGALAAIEASMIIPYMGGRTVLIGLPKPGVRASFDIMSFISGKTLISGFNGGTLAGESFQRLVDEVRSGEIEVASQISRIWPLDEVEDAIGAMRRGEVTRAVLDMR